MTMIHSSNAREYNNLEWNQNRILAPCGYWSNGPPATAVFKDHSHSTADDGNSQGQFASTASMMKNFQLDASQPIRRRSHRPRGCRGGRKNRKNKDSSVADSEGVSPQSPYLLRYNQNGGDDAPFEKPAVVKGDLSPFQHVKVNNAWNFGAQNYHIAPISAEKYSQMLPPPVPSALFECHRQMEESKMGLKMLPSFDDSDESAEGSFEVPPPPPSQHFMTRNSAQQWNELDCEATADTALSSSHSRSVSEDSDTSSTTSRNGGLQHHLSTQHGDSAQINLAKMRSAVGALPPKFTIQTTKTVTEGSSLFETSPRSFLLGISSTAAMRLQNSRTGKGMGNEEMTENVLSNNSNLPFEAKTNATQAKRRW